MRRQYAKYTERFQKNHPWWKGLLTKKSEQSVSHTNHCQRLALLPTALVASVASWGFMSGPSVSAARGSSTFACSNGSRSKHKDTRLHWLVYPAIPNALGGIVPYHHQPTRVWTLLKWLEFLEVQSDCFAESWFMHSRSIPQPSCFQIHWSRSLVQ